MMIGTRVHGGILIVWMLSGLAFMADETHAVRAEFDRCATLLDRVDREIRRYEQAIAQLGAPLSQPTHSQRPSTEQELTHLARRSDFLRHRLARARSQGDRIRDGLQEARGPICGSCPLALSVNLYCRNAESLLGEVEETFRRLREFESTLRTHWTREALEILRQVVPSPELPLQDRRKAVWRLASGLDYHRFEDVDTVSMTADQRDSFRKLTEVPLSVWTRAELRLTRCCGVLEEFAPMLHVSERRSRLSLPLRLRPAGGRLRFMVTPKVEKWYDDAVGDRPDATPFRRHNSDMGGMALTAHLTARPGPRKKLVWQMPFDLDWEHYRRNRPGYESFVEYRLTPSLEWRNEAHTLRGRVWAEARGEQYYGIGADTLDVNRFSVRLEGERRTPAAAVRLAAGWMTDRYLEVRHPRRLDRWEGSLQVQRQESARWASRFDTRYVHERNQPAAGDRSRMAGSGSELSLVPSITFRPQDHLSLSVEPRWERRWSGVDAAVEQAPAEQRLYLWEGRSAWELLTRFSLLLPSVDGALFAAFRRERMDDASPVFTTDSRALRTGAEMSLALPGPFTFNLFGDYQYRSHAPYGPHARVTENISFSTDLAAWLP